MNMKLPGLCLLALTIFNSCGKKYTCSRSITYQGEMVAFKGFSTAELSKVRIAKYRAGTHFAGLLSVDTVDYSYGSANGDTVFAEVAGPGRPFSTGFFSLELNIDYKVTILETGHQYQLTDILADGPTSETWTQKQHCSSGSSQSKGEFYQVNVNGAPAAYDQEMAYIALIYLQR